MRHGIKRWIIRYRYHRYQCQAAGPFSNRQRHAGKRQVWLRNQGLFPLPHYRVAVAAVECCQQAESVVWLYLDNLEYRKVQGPRSGILQRDYDTLVNRLCSGRLLHADETKVNVQTSWIGGCLRTWRKWPTYMRRHERANSSYLAERLQGRFGV